MRKTFALTVAAVALAGCGMLPGQPGGGGEERQSQVAAPDTPASSPAEEQPTEDQESPSAGEQSAPSQNTKAISTLEANVGAGDMHGKARADITALKRQGRTISLNWTVTTLDGKVNLHNGMSGAPLDYTVSAVSLIDPVNAKRYRVARNGTGEDAECVCSGTQGQFLEKGDSSTLYAVFAAPPADVTKINVEMPMFGVFTDVPIS
ncbi:hypothetical protein FE391_39540 [Nonomuraea sp. KC401]|uniref:hypothetical protein n=1 Tax=unclassified Nonomuraea TaxID=2593643 RepID=UPI0010FD8555|nr:MULTISPECIES: hypothetical protein [unclassified Nonomuraea]NBE95418.1 hypothetical protein [Nonomuraea sp. K271]TLF56395.1 hypothetical protein FE391_39540 [Nonomuraea sp. KC401]